MTYRYLFLCLFTLFTFTPPAACATKKIIFIDSYHPDYYWSNGLLQGIRKSLEDSEHDLKVHYMDTKNKRSEREKKEAGKLAKQVIEAFAPDVIIASDDNASQYLIAPYYRGAQTPVIFCGLNWNPSKYGYPAPNVTGMREVEHIPALLLQLQKYSNGSEIGFIGLNSLSQAGKLRMLQEKYGVAWNHHVLVDTYSQWKAAYLALQEKVDAIYISNFAGIKGWDGEDFKKVVRSQSKIPSGAAIDWAKDYAMITVAKSAEEQGRWAGQTALRILNGESPQDIPITENKSGTLYLNMGIADSLNITFDPQTIKRASIIRPYDDKTILHVDSYHTGYGWSEGIQEGIQQALANSGVRLIKFEMDTKRNSGEAFKVEAGRRARDLIEANKPDVVIASDDNASKYLIEPYYKESNLPIVFCGVNWDASAYGYPYRNATGMEEVDLVDKLANQLLYYAQGKRLGILALNRLTDKKMVQFWRDNLGLQIESVRFVDSFKQWCSAFQQFQDEVDVLILNNPAGLAGWDKAKAREVALSSVKIPTGTYDLDAMDCSLLGYIKSAEEQGYWSAKTALQIIDGTSPADIPITRNKEQIIMLNPQMVKQLGIMINPSFYKRATIYNEN